MTGERAWRAGWWWTLLTAIYLHGNLLHLVFNLLWVRQLAPAVEQLFGTARLVVIFTAGGVAGFVLSNIASGAWTIGASGAVFGLLGAMVAYGRSRGGTFGTAVFRQYGQWRVMYFGSHVLREQLGHAGGLGAASRRAAWDNRGTTERGIDGWRVSTVGVTSWRSRSRWNGFCGRRELRPRGASRRNDSVLGKPKTRTGDRKQQR